MNKQYKNTEHTIQSAIVTDSSLFSNNYTRSVQIFQNFPEIYKLPQNSKRQRGEKKQFPYRGATNIRGHLTKCRCNIDLVFYKPPLKTVSTLPRFSSVLLNKINRVCLSLLVTCSLYAPDRFCQGMIPFVRACTFAFDRVSLAYCPSVCLSVLSLSPHVRVKLQGGGFV